MGCDSWKRSVLQNSEKILEIGDAFTKVRLLKACDEVVPGNSRVLIRKELPKQSISFPALLDPSQDFVVHELEILLVVSPQNCVTCVPQIPSQNVDSEQTGVRVFNASAEESDRHLFVPRITTDLLELD